jgi:hypothetical protein
MRLLKKYQLGGVTDPPKKKSQRFIQKNLDNMNMQYYNSLKTDDKQILQDMMYRGVNPLTGEVQKWSDLRDSVMKADQMKLREFSNNPVNREKYGDFTDKNVRASYLDKYFDDVEFDYLEGLSKIDKSVQHDFDDFISYQKRVARAKKDGSEVPPLPAGGVIDPEDYINPKYKEMMKAAMDRKAKAEAAQADYDAATKESNTRIADDIDQGTRDEKGNKFITEPKKKFNLGGQTGRDELPFIPSSMGDFMRNTSNQISGLKTPSSGLNRNVLPEISGLQQGDVPVPDQLKTAGPDVSGLKTPNFNPVGVDIPSFNKSGAGENTNKFNMGNVMQGLGNAAPFLDNLANLRTALKTPQVPNALTVPRARMQTSFNINPQLNAIREAGVSANKAIDQGMSQSQVGQANKAGVLAERLRQEGELRGQKENAEVQMKNQQAMADADTGARNAEILNQNNLQKAAREDQVNQRLGAVVGNLGTDIMNINRESNMRNLDMEKFSIIAKTNPMAASDLVDTPTGKNYFKTNPNKLKESYAQAPEGSALREKLEALALELNIAL